MATHSFAAAIGGRKNVGDASAGPRKAEGGNPCKSGRVDTDS